VISLLISIKTMIFWLVTKCTSVEARRRFRGTYHVHLQGRRVSQARNVGNLPIADVSLGPHLDPEDGGYTFVRNVRGLLANHTSLQVRSSYSSRVPTREHQFQQFISILPPEFLFTRSCKHIVTCYNESRCNFGLEIGFIDHL
jgi:hypothetical protein